MPFIITYLLKLSLSLAVVFLFYQFVLRKLTFYNWNRWYLLGYTLLSFVIPFIDISPVLERNEWTQVNAVNWVPVIGEYQVTGETQTSSGIVLNSWNISLLLLFTGMLVMLFRLLFQLISFNRMMRRAKSIPGEGMKLYQVDEEIIPFSFGNSIFINQRLHTPEELQDIIRHEFVHVKQKHSIDIIWGELLCMINWYNPFAWLLKRSIRQNLEFIADNKVLGSGINKKQYQYLLLKVIGNNQFSIAQKFNFSSLKKRIAMMNKLKTARLHLVRFLFILPFLAVILLSFRKQIGDQFTRNDKNNIADTVPAKNLSGIEDWNPVPTESQKDFERRHSRIEKITWGYILSVNGFEVGVHGQAGDAIMQIHFKNGKWDMYNLGLKSDIEKFRKNYGEEPPKAPAPPKSLLNDKAYFVTIRDVKGNCTVVVKDKTGNEVDRLSLNEWDAKKEHYENLYGDILPPLEPPVPPDPPGVPSPPTVADIAEEIVPGTKEFYERNPDVKSLGWTFNNPNENKAVLVHVTKKDGKTEQYDLRDAADKARGEKKYGQFPIPNAPPPADETIDIVAEEVNLTSIADNFEITDKKATMHLKNGVTEVYDLTKREEKKKFELKFGKIISPLSGVNEAVTINSVKGNNIVFVPSHVTVSDVANLTTATPTKTNIASEMSLDPITVTGKKSPTTVIAGPTKTNIASEMSLDPITVTGTLKTDVAVASESSVTVAGVQVPDVSVIDEVGEIVGGTVDVIVTISKYTTRDQLEAFKKQMKDKGVELEFDKTEYNSKGVLTSISGRMRSKETRNNFSASDFDKLILSVITSDGRTYFRVQIKEKEVS